MERDLLQSRFWISRGRHPKRRRVEDTWEVDSFGEARKGTSMGGPWYQNIIERVTSPADIAGHTGTSQRTASHSPCANWVYEVTKRNAENLGTGVVMSKDVLNQTGSSWEARARHS